MRKKTFFSFQDKIKKLPKQFQQDKIRKNYSTVEIILKKGKNLAVRDANGKSDPYCVLHCDGGKLQSGVKKKTLNCEWNEVFEFSVPVDEKTKELKPKSFLRIDVWDKDFFFKDDFMGTYTLDLSTLHREKSTKLNVNLLAVETGDLEIEILAHNFGLDAEKLALLEKKKEAEEEQLFIALQEKMKKKEQSSIDKIGNNSGESRDSTRHRLQGKDRYKRKEFLASGGFGQVFIAIDLKTGDDQKEVVCKRVVCKSFEEANKSFQEVWPIRNLNHPALVQYTDLYLDPIGDGSFGVCFIMDYYKQGDLMQYLKRKKSRKKPLEYERVLSYSLQLSKGLAYLHGQKFMHRDLKPQNVLMCEKSKIVRICDFGLVREMDASLAQTVCGTQEFMAPEIFLKQPYGMTADIFSLGGILYEMISLNFGQNHNLKLAMEKEKFFKRITTEMCEHNEKLLPVAEIVCSMLQSDPLKRINLADAISKLEKLQKQH